MNKLITKIVGAALGVTMAVGVGVAVASNSKETTPAHASAPNDSGINAGTGKFVIDFYDSSKLSSTSGTGLSSSNYSTFVKVDTGLTKTNVVTGVSVTGTVQYGKNGGLTAGTGTAAASTSHYVTFNIGSNYAVTKCSVYATAYETGRWLLNGNAADSGSLGSKGATIANVTSPLVWDNLGGITALTFKKDNGSGGNQKRLTIYTIVCEYATGGATLSSIAVKTAPTTTYYEGQYFDPTGLVITGTYSDESTEDIAYADHSSDFKFTPSTSTALSTSNTSVTIEYGGKSTTQAISVSTDVLNSVSISGNMSTTSYTNVSSWDKAGLVVTASYTGKGDVDVTSSATINYYSDSAMTSEVETPNDLGLGENQTIYIKATFSGVSNSTGYGQTVTVTEKTNLGNLEDGERFFLIVGGHVLKAGSFAQKGADAYTTDSSATTGLGINDAWYFSYADEEDTWYIRTSSTGNYLRCYSDNNGLACDSTSDKWTVLEGTGTLAGSLVLKDRNQSRYISYTTNTGAHIRTYTGTGTGTPTVSFVKYEDAILEITGNTESYTDTSVTLTSNAGASTAWSITSDPNSVGSLSSASGASVTLSASDAGAVTVTASAAGYISDTHTVTFTVRPSNYIDLSLEITDGTSSLGVNGKGLLVTVDNSHLSGDIVWSVSPSGAISGIDSDNSGFAGTINATGSITITATDDGDNSNTNSVSFTSIESLNSINAYTDGESTLTFTTTYASGGATADDGVSWTVTSDGSESNYDSARGIHYGTGSLSVQYLQLVSGSFSDTVTSVKVNASDANGTSDLTVTVGSTSFSYGEESSTKVANSNPGADYLFTGEATGAITVRLDRGSAATKAIYVKSIVVSYRSSSTSNIANTNASVQQEVLTFVSTMNTDLSVCSGTATLSTSVWSTLGGKFEIAAENSSNESLFRRMFKYADATPRAGDGTATTGDTLQNALARYNYVLEKYGTSNYADFLHRAEANKVTPKVAQSNALLGLISQPFNGTAVSIIVIVSMVSLTAIGGYFFLRKRKEQ